MSHPKWITLELIKFSKQAKKLGFPQDVKEGDWVSTNNPVTKEPFDYPELARSDKVFVIGDTLFIIDDEEQFERNKGDWQLILTFSRCLEWLRGKGYFISLWEQKPKRKFALTFGKEMAMGRTAYSLNIDIVGVKAVIKALEKK